MIRNLFQRAALAAAISACVAGASIASETERLSVQIDQDGRSETVLIEGLQPGDTRQLAAESGKPVIVTRTEEAYEIDIDGDITRVPVQEQAFALRLHGDGARAGEAVEGKRIVRVLHAGHAGEHEKGTHVEHVRQLDGAGPDGEAHRVVVVRHAGEGGLDIEAVLGEAGIDAAPADGKRVIVRRERVK